MRPQFMGIFLTLTLYSAFLVGCIDAALPKDNELDSDRSIRLPTQVDRSIPPDQYAHDYGHDVASAWDADEMELDQWISDAVALSDAEFQDAFDVMDAMASQEDQMVVDASYEENVDAWTPPPTPTDIACSGPGDIVTACHWLAQCLASQGCPTASSELQQVTVEYFCRQNSDLIAANLACTGIPCGQWAQYSTWCHRLSN